MEIFGPDDIKDKDKNQSGGYSTSDVFGDLSTVDEEQIQRMVDDYQIKRPDVIDLTEKPPGGMFSGRELFERMEQNKPNMSRMLHQKPYRGLTHEQRQYRKGPSNISFDPDGDDYDYETAKEAGIQPDETGHWPSLDPRTGMVLKGRGHSTFDKTLATEAQLGNKVIKKNNRYYSVSTTDPMSKHYVPQGLSDEFDSIAMGDPMAAGRASKDLFGDIFDRVKPMTEADASEYVELEEGVSSKELFTGEPDKPRTVAKKKPDYTAEEMFEQSLGVPFEPSLGGALKELVGVVDVASGGPIVREMMKRPATASAEDPFGEYEGGSLHDALRDLGRTMIPEEGLKLGGFAAEDPGEEYTVTITKDMAGKALPALVELGFQVGVGIAAEKLILKLASTGMQSVGRLIDLAEGAVTPAVKELAEQGKYLLLDQTGAITIVDHADAVRKTLKTLNPEGREMLMKARQHFGITDDPLKAGFLSPDGAMLDLSGKGKYQQRLYSSKRNLAHFEISTALGGKGSVEELFSFMDKAKTIRMSVSPRDVAIEFSHYPTALQLDEIMEMSHGKTIWFDLVEKDGTRIGSWKFDNYVDFEKFLRTKKQTIGRATLVKSILKDESGAWTITGGKRTDDLIDLRQPKDLPRKQQPLGEAPTIQPSGREPVALSERVLYPEETLVKKGFTTPTQKISAKEARSAQRVLKGTFRRIQRSGGTIKPLSGAEIKALKFNPYESTNYLNKEVMRVRKEILDHISSGKKSSTYISNRIKKLLSLHMDNDLAEIVAVGSRFTSANMPFKKVPAIIKDILRADGYALRRIDPALNNQLKGILQTTKSRAESHLAKIAGSKGWKKVDVTDMVRELERNGDLFRYKSLGDDYLERLRDGLKLERTKQTPRAYRGLKHEGAEGDVYEQFPYQYGEEAGVVQETGRRLDYGELESQSAQRMQGQPRYGAKDTITSVRDAGGPGLTSKGRVPADISDLTTSISPTDTARASLRKVGDFLDLSDDELNVVWDKIGRDFIEEYPNLSLTGKKFNDYVYDRITNKLDEVVGIVRPRIGTPPKNLLRRAVDFSKKILSGEEGTWTIRGPKYTGELHTFPKEDIKELHNLVRKTVDELDLPSDWDSLMKGDIASPEISAIMREQVREAVRLGREAGVPEEALTRRVRRAFSDSELEDFAHELGVTPDKLRQEWKLTDLNPESVYMARKAAQEQTDRVIGLAREIDLSKVDDVDKLAKEVQKAITAQVGAKALKSDVGRALQAAQIDIGGTEHAKQLGKFFADLGGKETVGNDMLKRIVKLAKDHPDNPRLINLAIQRHIVGRGRRISDAAFEVWVNGILSAPTTHIVNSVSNTATMLVSMPERGLAAVIDKFASFVSGAKRTRYVNEVAAQFTALKTGMPDAIRRGIDEFLGRGFNLDKLSKGENAWVADIATEIQKRAKTKFEQGSYGASLEVALPSKLGDTKAARLVGEFVRAPGKRLLTPADNFYKVLNGAMEMKALAVRTALDEGKVGKAIGKRVAELLTDPSPDMITKAVDAAEYRVFQKGLEGKAIKSVKQFRNSLGGIPRFILPFVDTPVNIVAYGAEYSPIGFAQGLWKYFGKRYADDAARIVGRGQAADHIARATIGTTLGAGIGWMVSNGQVTGGGPRDRTSKAAWLAAGNQPYSIKVGNTWISYKRMEPFSLVLSTAADLIENFGTMPESERVGKFEFIGSLFHNAVVDQTFLRGLSDVIKAITDERGSAASWWARRFSGSLIPYSSLLAWSARSYDPTRKNIGGTWDYIRSRAPWSVKDVPDMLDVWGEPIPMLQEGRSRAWMTLPYYTKVDNPRPIDVAVIESGARLGRPGKSIVVRGERRMLTPEQHNDYIRTAGQGAKVQISEMMRSATWKSMSKDEKKDYIEAVVDQSRKYARAVIKNKYFSPQGITQESPSGSDSPSSNRPW